MVKNDEKEKNEREKKLILFWLSFFIDANNLPSTEQATKTQPKQGKFFSLIFHRF